MRCRLCMCRRAWPITLRVLTHPETRPRRRDSGHCSRKRPLNIMRVRWRLRQKYLRANFKGDATVRDESDGKRELSCENIAEITGLRAYIRMMPLHPLLSQTMMFFISEIDRPLYRCYKASDSDMIIHVKAQSHFVRLPFVLEKRQPLRLLMHKYIYVRIVRRFKAFSWRYWRALLYFLF